MQKDIAILESGWNNLHPGLLRFNTREEMQKHFAQIKKTCSIPMTEKKFYILLGQLSEKVKCGHTYPNPLNLDSITAERLLPSKLIPVFFIITQDKKILVTHNLSGVDGLTKGDEITSINGINAKRIIDSLLTVSRSDGKNGIGKKLNNISETPDEANKYSLFDIYFPLFFRGNQEKYNIKYQRAGGKISVVTIPLLTCLERIKRYESIFGPLPVGPLSWNYKLLADSIAYMKFGTFAFWNSSFKPAKYIDSVFDLVNKTSSVTNLIIDIRENEGGDNSGNLILSYLLTKPICWNEIPKRCYKYLTIPDSLLPYLSTWDRSFKQPKEPAQFKVNELGLYERIQKQKNCDTIYPRQNGFKGKVFLLIGPKNSSAAFEMAWKFKREKLGTLVGEMTGGCQQGINGSEFFFLRLPESKFEIDLPLVYNYFPNKPDKGIEPDKYISISQKDIAAGRDSQLELCLKLIHGER